MCGKTNDDEGLSHLWEKVESERRLREKIYAEREGTVERPQSEGREVLPGKIKPWLKFWNSPREIYGRTKSKLTGLIVGIRIRFRS
jgi:hypothetical protein